MKAAFSLNGLMLLEIACWRKSPIVANPPLYTTLNDDGKKTLSLRISDSLQRSQIAHARGEDDRTELTFDGEEEVWHLVQGIDIFSRAGREEIGLGVLTLLYELLREKDSEKAVERLQGSLGLGDAAEEDKSYEAHTNRKDRSPTADQPIGDT